MRSARMKEVAEQVGVSISTVSRALSSPERVSPDVRERVLAAVRALDYRLNTSARNMRVARTGLVMVLLPDVGNPFFSVVLKGIQQRSRELGLFALVADIGTDPVVSSHHMRQIDARRFDGMILLNGRTPAMDGSEFGLPEDYPTVVVAERVPNARLPSVLIDNRAAAAKAVTVLGQGGHKAIAHVAGLPDNIVSQERTEGYDQALRSLGLATRYRRVWHGDYSVISGRMATRVLMAEAVKPTAVFVSNDVMSFGVIAELKALGFRVPEDVSVIGFDDLELSAAFDPPLTTVRQPRFDMGYVATSILARRIAGDLVQPDETILASELVVRNSTR